MSNWFARSGKVTTTLIGINVLVFLATLSSGGQINSLLALDPATVFEKPWTLVTFGFVHANWMHIIFNMYSLWIFGDALERTLGRNRYIILYFGALLASGLATIFTTTDQVVGASGAIFGLMGAYFVIIRAMGYRSSQILVLIAINVFFSFTDPSIALAAHLGGLAAGAAIAWYFVQGRRK